MWPLWPYSQHKKTEVVYQPVKSMQRSETGAIRTQLQPSKQKRVIINITNSQNTKRTYGQPSEQLFPKRWPGKPYGEPIITVNRQKVKYRQ